MSTMRMLGLGVAAMGALAGLDLIGAYLAKEFSLRPRPLTLVAGALTFVILFLVYARSLRVAELWVVTFGWVALLEIGVLLLDRLRYGAEISTSKWIAAFVIIVLQLVLMLPEPLSSDLR